MLGFNEYILRNHTITNKFLSPALCTGTTLAVFRQVGKIPKSKQALNNITNTGDKTSDASTIIFAFIPSELQLLLIFKLIDYAANFKSTCRI